jgi:hypothetical protein
MTYEKLFQETCIKAQTTLKPFKNSYDKDLFDNYMFLLKVIFFIDKNIIYEGNNDIKSIEEEFNKLQSLISDTKINHDSDDNEDEDEDNIQSISKINSVSYDDESQDEDEDNIQSISKINSVSYDDESDDEEDN